MGKAGFIAEAFCETLWPTRCAICDAPGHVLCPSCARALAPLDLWQACPVCGAPWGRLECDHCTPVVDPEPFEGIDPETRRCVAALRYTDEAATLIKTFKDKGEQRLAGALAAMIQDAVFPSWPAWAEGITYITATRAARRRRGFDHMQIVAENLATRLDLPCLKLLEEPKTFDQRALSRRERTANMADRFRVVESTLPTRVILIDDVFTTGATVRAAQRALFARGCSAKVATVARV